MPDSAMSPDEAFSVLQRVDPVASERSSVPQPQQSREALFEETIMNGHSSTGDEVATRAPRLKSIPSTTYDNQRPSGGAPSPRKQPWRHAIVSRAALVLAVLAVLGGAFGFVAFGGAPPATALEQVVAAAENSSSTDSGVITIAMHMRTLEGIAGNARADVVFRYDDGDYEMSWTLDGVDDPDAVNAAQLRVDGQFYERTADDPEWRIHLAGAEDSVADRFGIGPNSIDPESLVPLLDVSETVVETTPEDADDGVHTYAGTLLSERLTQLPEDSLPAGMGLFAGEDLSTLPPTILIDAVVIDDRLDTVVFTLTGDTDEGAIDLTITTSFSDYGEPQNLEAPQDVEPPFDEEALMAALSPEERASRQLVIDALEELEARRPGLCGASSPAVSFTVDNAQEIADARSMFGEWIRCYRDSGESEAAALFLTTIPRVLLDDPRDVLDWMGAGPELDAVAERSPGLCAELSPLVDDFSPGDLGYDLTLAMEAYASCLDDGGESEAATAVRAAATPHLMGWGG